MSVTAGTKLHPLAALRTAGRLALLVGSSAFFIIATSSSLLGAFDFALVFLLAPVGAVLGAAYGIAYYVRFEYELGDETLTIRSGVFGRREREIPLRRVQNVDLQQSVLQRAIGLAVVRVETAGGGQTEAVLDFVALEEAERLQREIRKRKRSQLEIDDGSPESSTPLFALGDVELGLYALTSFRPASALILVFTVPFGWDIASDVILRLAAPLGGPPTLDPASLVSVAGLVLSLVALVVAGLTSWAISFLLTLFGYHGFTLARVGDDLVYERGLLRRYSGSIPMEKVQTVTIVEHVLARRLGYAGLRVETAGYSGGGEATQSGRGSARPASAVPLAARERVLDLARRVEPFDDVEFTRPARTARRRYAARYLGGVVAITGLLYGVGMAVGGLEYWPAPLALLPAVPVAAHLKWANRGYHVGPTHAAFREGFWRRRTRVVPYYRLQTVETRRTIFQRRLDLASVIADTASSGALLGSAAVAHDLTTETGRRLHRELRDRLSLASGR